VLCVERQPEDVLLGEQLTQVVRVLRLLVDLGRARSYAFPGDLPDDLAERELLVREEVRVRCGLVRDGFDYADASK
jgi:hypothetical protein